MSQFPAPPVRTPFPDKGWNTDPRSGTLKQQGSPVWAWLQWFQAITNRFNATPITVTGSRGGNVALANLLSALAEKGFIVDNTTP